MDYIVKGSIFLSIATIIKAMTKLGLFVEVFDKCDDEEIEVRTTNIGNNQKTAFDFKYSVMARRKKPENETTEQARARRTLESIADNATRSEIVS